jgi:hypothetical protein
MVLYESVFPGRRMGFFPAARRFLRLFPKEGCENRFFPDVSETAEVRMFLLDDVLTVRQQGDSYGSVSRLPS